MSGQPGTRACGWVASRLDGDGLTGGCPRDVVPRRRANFVRTMP